MMSTQFDVIDLGDHRLLIGPKYLRKQALQ